MVAIADNAVDRIEAMLLKGGEMPGLKMLVEADLITQHFFAPGIYARALTRKAGAFIIGHKHRQEHLNLLLCGRLRVYMDGKVNEIAGPSLPFISKAGVRKATFALEDSTLITFHPTQETDLDKLEDELIEKSPLFEELEAAGIIAKLRAGTDVPALQP